MKPPVLAPVLALALALAATPVLADQDADAAAIRARLEAWRVAFNARDAEGACDLFAPDLAYSVTGLTAGTRETMCGNFARTMMRTDLLLRYDPPEIHEIVVAGDIAVVRLRWTLTTQTLAERLVTHEEGLDVFRRQPDGRWSIARFVAVDG